MPRWIDRSIDRWIDFLMSRRGRTAFWSLSMVGGLAVTVLWILQGSDYFGGSWGARLRTGPFFGGPVLMVIAAYFLYRTLSGLDDRE